MPGQARPGQGYFRVSSKSIMSEHACAMWPSAGRQEREAAGQSEREMLRAGQLTKLRLARPRRAHNNALANANGLCTPPFRPGPPELACTCCRIPVCSVFSSPAGPPARFACPTPLPPSPVIFVSLAGRFVRQDPGQPDGPLDWRAAICPGERRPVRAPRSPNSVSPHGARTSECVYSNSRYVMCL